jgi:FAD:protein FMN transferase
MIHTVEFRSMGCRMMAAADNPSPRIRRRLDQLPGWFEEWEQALSRFREDSELSRLNRSQGLSWKASPVMWGVFQAALEAEEYSAGLVTPLILEAVLAAGYTTSFEKMGPVMPGVEVPLQTIPPAACVGLYPAIRSLRLPPGVRLDFGGVAKGWAAHQAMRRLEPYGPALVDAGGDIAVSGLQQDGQPWYIGVENPFEPGADLMTLQIGRCGVATSGRDTRAWVHAGRNKHHIIDPRTGQPAETDVLTATVIAPDVLTAETAAKTVFILGSKSGKAWLEARPNLAGLLVLENEQQIQSKHFESYVVNGHGFPPANVGDFVEVR